MQKISSMYSQTLILGDSSDLSIEKKSNRDRRRYPKKLYLKLCQYRHKRRKIKPTEMIRRLDDKPKTEKISQRIVGVEAVTRKKEIKKSIIVIIVEVEVVAADTKVRTVRRVRSIREIIGIAVRTA